MKIETLKQLSVFMPNRPGALARLTALFAERGINVLGIASEVRDDSGLVRLALAADSDAASILTAAGFSSVETTILSVELDDKPGQLRKIADALAEAKINITTVYGTSVGGAMSARLLINTPAIEKAVAVLEPLSRSASI